MKRRLAFSKLELEGDHPRVAAFQDQIQAAEETIAKIPGG